MSIRYVLPISLSLLIVENFLLEKHCKFFESDDEA